MTKDDIGRIMEMIHDMMADIDEELFNDTTVSRALDAIELALYDAAELPQPDQPIPVSPSGSAG